jgi:deferrochelatase/peroxidase EfeB
MDILEPDNHAGGTVPSRRRLLAGAGAAAAGAVTGGLAGHLAWPRPGAGPAAADTGPAPGDGHAIPFYGPHQAGIVSPVQDRLVLGTMNAVPGASGADLRDLLRRWTTAAARMVAGEPAGEVTDPYAPPADTGEAIGSPVSRLTITLGYGPSLFDRRFGLGQKKPAVLVPLPPLPGERLDPRYIGGDLCIQACSDDPLVAFHAVRNLARIGMGVVENDWMELGFGRTSTTSTERETPRNLLGFKDGTRNIKADQTQLLNDHVWAGHETDQPWLRGGSYLVVRKIRIFIENWDRDYLRDQENVIGRAKTSGAPLSGGTELSAPDFTATGSDGVPAIPAHAHIRLASFEHNGGTRILRRGYSFTDGIDPQSGTLLGGLLFIAFMKDPGQFIRIQRALAADALNEYTQHTGSAVFACPPGLRRGQYWGDDLFA